MGEYPEVIKDWSREAEIEIRGVRMNAPGTDLEYISVDDAKPEWFSVYTRGTDNCATCIGAFKDYNEAVFYAVGIKGAHPHLVVSKSTLKAVDVS